MSSVNVPIDCDDIGWDWVNVVVNGGMDLELMYNRILGEASGGFKDNLVVYMINGLICILICFLYRGGETYLSSHCGSVGDNNLASN